MQKIFIVICLFVWGCTAAPRNGSSNEKVNNWFLKAKQYINQNTDTIKHCMEAIQQTADTTVGEQKCKLYYVQGIYQLSSGKNKNAEELLLVAKNVAQQIHNDTLEGYTLLAIGSSNLYSGDMAKALDAYLSATALFKRSNDNSLIEKAYSSLALAYYNNFDTANAKKYVQLINTASDKQSRSYLIGLHVESNIFTDNNLLDSALQKDQLGVTIATENNSMGMVTAFYDNMATCYLQQNKFDSAQYFYYKCLAIDSSGGQTQKMADTYAKLVYLTAKLKDEKKLTAIVNKAKQFCDSTHFIRGKYNIYLGLVDFYTQKGNAQQTLVLKDSLISFKDKMINKESQDKIDELSVQYKTLEQEAIITKQQNSLQRNQLLLIISLVATVLLIVIFYSFYKNAQRNKMIAIDKAIQQQKEENIEAVFESEQQERIRIARDLHDSVGQKLSVLKMYLSADDIKKENVEQLLDDTINEVRSISHNLIPEALNFGLLSAITFTVNQLQANSTIQTSCIIDDNCRDVKIDLLRSLNIFRVFQEIIGNAVKHSQATTIAVNISFQSPQLIITLTDNGTGLHEADIKTSGGIGWKNIASRTDLLKAHLQIVPGTLQGTIIQLQVPVV